MSGKVYFIAAPGRIKIGWTTQPEKRLAQLRYTDMDELSVLGVIDGSRSLERRIHNLVDKHRRRGEWFADVPEVRAIVNDAIAGHITDPENTATAAASYDDIPDDVLLPEIPELSLLFNQEPGRLDAALKRLEQARARRIAAEALLESLLAARTETAQGSGAEVAATPAGEPR